MRQILLIILLVGPLLLQLTFAEGTKQLEPTNPATTTNRRTRIMFDQTASQHRTPFATINCAEKYRLNVYINNPATEQIYFGFNDGDNTLFYQIKDPDGIIVAGYSLAQVPASGQGYIGTWNQAFAGPKIGSANPTGYDPKILTPTKSGNYYFEFAPTATGGTFSGKDMLYFDIAVVQGSAVIDGRLWSKAWQLSDDASGDLIKSYPAMFYIYTDDGIVTKLNINEWNGGTYTIYCNQWGATNTGNWTTDRMSKSTWPGSDLPQYKVFLNEPDVNVFATGQLGDVCEVQALASCSGKVDFLVRVNKPGSLTLNLDIAPSGPGPEDVVINQSIYGSSSCDVWDTITWNGVDGSGNPVPNGTAVSVDVDYLNGLTNLPLWDVEDNASGLIVNLVRPLPSLFNNKLPIYWDDSNLPQGTVNSVNGCVYPSSTSVSGCHHWTNQNENMINSWWYFSDGYPLVSFTVKRDPQANFTYTNNCTGTPTLFLDQSNVPGGYPVAWRWGFGLMGDTSSLQNPAYVFTSSGNKLISLKVTSNNGCQGSTFKNVMIYPAPVPYAGEDKLIPYGSATTLQGTAYGGSGSYTYHWEPSGLLLNPDISGPATVNLYTSTDFTMTVTDQVNSCYQSDDVKVIVTGGPLGAQIQAEPDSVCPGETTFINVQASGGSGMYSYQWTSVPPGFTSNQEDVTVQPNATTTYTVVISDGISTVTKSITIHLHNSPVSSAGNDQTIPFGTSTFLSGTASLGKPPYTYAWSPASMVVAPTQSNTATAIITGTITYTLTVTDNHGCIATDQLTISVSGGPLMVNPSPEQNPICIGESTVLNPYSQGGSGNYTYHWTDGSGFSTNNERPVVSPTQTTTYYLSIFDGYTTSTGSTTLTVNALPVINLIPSGSKIVGQDTILSCIYDTVTLSAAGTNRTYLWSNGAVTPEIHSSTSGIAFDIQTFSVFVTNSLTGCSNTAKLSIMFAYSECTYGVPEKEPQFSVLFYPNPCNGLFTCEVKADSGKLEFDIFDVMGKKVTRKTVEFQPGISQKVLFDISDQPAGLYILRITSGNGSMNMRIVKL